MSVSVAMSEIVREGTWALRALGYPYGIAERACFMLAWTEAVHGNALTLLREGETRIVAGAALPAPHWTRGDDGARRADAGGKCLFECGPPALDLATADARLHGTGRAVLRGVIGTRLAASLAAMAGRRGLACALVHVPGPDEIAPVPAAGWICVLPAEQGPAFLTGSLDAALPPILHEAGKDIGTAHAGGHGGFLGITALTCPPMQAPAGATDWPGRVALAYRTGTSADPQDYQHLYELEMRTWAPSSERSRAQAGY